MKATPSPAAGWPISPMVASPAYVLGDLRRAMFYYTHAIDATSRLDEGRCADRLQFSGEKDIAVSSLGSPPRRITDAGRTLGRQLTVKQSSAVPTNSTKSFCWSDGAILLRARGGLDSFFAESPTVSSFPAFS